MKKILKSTVLILAALAVLALCACSSKNGYSVSDSISKPEYDMPSASEEPSYDNAYEDYYESPKTDGGYSGLGDTSDVKNDLASRKLIKNVNMEIQTKTYDDFISELKALINQYGGYIQSSELHDSGSYYSTRYASIVARVPADALAAFTDGLYLAGTVTYYREGLEDVTLSYVDIESRIKSLRTEYETLNELLKEAKELDYVIMLQQRLTEVRYQIESYESQIRTYDDLISYSTVSMSVREVERETVVEKQGTWDEIGTNISANISDIGEGLRRFFVNIASGLPYILIAVVIVGVVTLIVVRIVKRAKKK